MDIAVSELRANLREWLERAQSGDEVVVTDHGIPVARILGIAASPRIERLTTSGVIARAARTSRPRATGRSRPRPTTSVADIVSRQRD